MSGILSQVRLSVIMIVELVNILRTAYEENLLLMIYLLHAMRL